MLRVLIVEDEILLAMDLELMLQDAGCVSVGIAANAAQAIGLAEATHPDLALVDVNLSDGPTGIDIARRLSGRTATSVVFMTANVAQLPSDCAGAVGVISKPYTSSGVAAALSYLRQGLLAPPPRLATPSCLQLSSQYKTQWSL